MALASPSLSISDRRALARQYRDSLRPMGVYAVRNLATGGVLVAGSLDLDAALQRLTFELRLNSHRRHPRLQQDWNRLGAQAFRIDVVQRLRERPEDPHFDYARELNGLLEVWQEELQAFGPDGYNAPARRPE